MGPCLCCCYCCTSCILTFLGPCFVWFFLFQLLLVFLWLAANNINIITTTIPKSGTIKLNEQLLPRSKSSTGGWLQILFFSNHTFLSQQRQQQQEKTKAIDRSFISLFHIHMEEAQDMARKKT